MRVRAADSEPWDQLIDRASGRLDSMVEQFLAKVMTEPAYTVSALTRQL